MQKAYLPQAKREVAKTKKDNSSSALERANNGQYAQYKTQRLSTTITDKGLCFRKVIG